MPKPNFYMSDKDRTTLLSLITDYIAMFEDSEPSLEDEIYKELQRVRKKIRNIENTKSFKNAIVQDALEISKRVLSRKHKRLSLDSPTCGTCEHWKETEKEWIGYCPILKESTEMDELCNDFEDMK
ncbi:MULTISPECIES: hypothetical protein [unclassified Clostridium]|uniref:hypothetical protein n=1 Tax=unclassified Clostridium TaxID=2614128 RepID=UPI0013FB8B4B|nr:MULTISPECIES: hypothetical protein [unclassified Clostridium]NFR85785.1 hypothetical protein [Clostridium botulinum]NFR91419.1 hypothetical protein [Clostridium botulinum]NFT99316.1 hypothetical protein [Clostridium botulinum]